MKLAFGNRKHQILYFALCDFSYIGWMLLHFHCPVSQDSVKRQDG